MKYKGLRVFRGKLFEKVIAAGEIKLIFHGDILCSFFNASTMKDLLDEKNDKLYSYDITGNMIVLNGEVFVRDINALFPYKYNNKNINTYKGLIRVALKLNKQDYGINIPNEEKSKVKKYKSFI